MHQCLLRLIKDSYLNRKVSFIKIFPRKLYNISHTVHKLFQSQSHLHCPARNNTMIILNFISVKTDISLYHCNCESVVLLFCFFFWGGGGGGGGGSEILEKIAVKVLFYFKHRWPFCSGLCNLVEDIIRKIIFHLDQEMSSKEKT